MKVTLFLVFFFFFFTSLAQTKRVLVKLEGKNVCGWDENPSVPSFYAFPDDDIDEVRKIVEEICKRESIAPEFVIQRGQVDNSIAMVDSNIRYIYYNKSYFRSLGNKWFVIGILAHEIAHHLNSHTFLADKAKRVNDELVADDWAGKVLCELGAPYEILSTLIDQHCSTQGSEFYPSKVKRLEAITNGYANARCGTTSGIRIKKFSPELKAEIDKVNYFDTTPFKVEGLDLSQNFRIDFKIKSVLQGGSVRYGIAFNYDENNRNYTIFTLHSKVGYTPGFSFTPGNNYSRDARLSEGDLKINGEIDFDILSIEKKEKTLIFYINQAEVWRTSNIKIYLSQFALWAADNSEVILDSYTLNQQ